MFIFQQTIDFYMIFIKLLCTPLFEILSIVVSESLLFNAKFAIFQLYHRLIFNKKMIFRYRPTRLVFIVLSH